MPYKSKEAEIEAHIVANDLRLQRLQRRYEEYKESKKGMSINEDQFMEKHCRVPRSKAIKSFTLIVSAYYNL